LKLSITTPFSIIVDQEKILSLRAEDATGNFGILPLHADFMTLLEVSVISWRDDLGEVCYCAVSNGILIVTAGEHVSIATREAVLGKNLSDLRHHVLGKFNEAIARENKVRISQERNQAEALRRVQNYLHQDVYNA
jgi:F-type H+-transporting ATPase subunit epsilon|tara:strand:- start:11447 stop:11854 length:408 start_codon:yes stop_codon:yes gene_type:complete